MGEAPFVWDACGLLNLAATQRAEEILAALRSPCYVVSELLQGEVLYLRPLPEEDPQRTKVPVDFTDLLKAGFLKEITLSPEEKVLFTDYAREVDDGEARTAAVAVVRGFQVVTDDRAAVAFLRRLGAPPRVITTTEWLKFWADAMEVRPEALADAVRRVEECATYRPRRMDPLLEWWTRARG